MKTISTASALREAIHSAKANGQRVGFVPTMGALHAGHAALVTACREECDLVIASIFVNPTQFNESSDLDAYPRTPESDARLLQEHGCDLLYQPSTEDIYPDGTEQSLAAHLDFGTLTERMEGANRPGHFQGVAQVVSRLLDVVQPDVLYLGQKDYQQVAVIRCMIKLLDLPVGIRVVSTVREGDGLALSSRNRRMSPDERRAAGSINRQLSAIVSGLRSGWPARELEVMAMNAMRDLPLLDPEYVEIFDGHTLLPYVDGDPVEELVVATAVRVGPVRLIDNRIAFQANPNKD